MIHIHAKVTGLNQQLNTKSIFNKTFTLDLKGFLIKTV